MDIPYAIANKFRPGKDRTNLLGIIGDCSNKKVAIITDDESVTGSSIINAVHWLFENGVHEIHAAISHLKIREEHIGAFNNAHEHFGLKTLHTTDTIPQTSAILNLPYVRVHSLAQRFASTINRLHYNQSVSALFQNGYVI